MISAMQLNLRQYRALTFDCYGTLVDWEQGILQTLRPLLREYGVDVETDEALLQRYAHLEAEAESRAFLPYKEILRQVMHGFADTYHLPTTPTILNVFVENFDLWRPFGDTVEALQRLSRYVSLNVISNVDDDLFAITARHLLAPFTHIITAQSVGSYKPNPRNFEVALECIALPKNEILHVAQSLYHDIAPAREVGLTTVWVNRRAGKEGTGATPASNATPHLEIPDLQTLANLIEESHSQT
jgi:2-haloacid dehalogenase